MPNRVRARLIVRYVDGDAGKAAALRGRLRALAMVRRDSNGEVILEQILEGERPGPPDDGGPP